MVAHPAHHRAAAAGRDPGLHRQLRHRLGALPVSLNDARAALVFFILVVTPLGWLLRLMGKDPLQLKRRKAAPTFWQKSKAASPLDQLF